MTQRVSIVDDEDSARMSVELALTMAGYSVVGTADGREAIQQNMSGMELSMLTVIETTSAFTTLMIWAAEESGIIYRDPESGAVDVQPIVARLVPFLNAKRQALIALGMKRRVYSSA